MKLKELNWLKDKPVIKISIGLVIIMLITNTVFLSLKNKHSLKYPSGDEIENYAISYTRGAKREKKGRKMDCSAFTHDVYKHFGIRIPHSALNQSKQSASLDVNKIKKGNLIFFRINENTISHVGIYLGNEKFIHSPGHGKYVRIDSLGNKYWKQRFVAGGKITSH